MQTEVLFEDQHIIVVYKPAGLAVQTAQLGRQDMESELKNYLRQPFLGIVHRLDQPVEGVLVFGKTQKATAALNRQLSQTEFCKEYLAVVCGNLLKKQQELVDYLVKDGNRARICNPAEASGQQAKKAVLQYECLDTVLIDNEKKDNENIDSRNTHVEADSSSNILIENTAPSISLLKVNLQTGRFHQIRVQLSGMGNPILGDSKYGTSESALISQELLIKNVALCAHKLVFMHPSTNKRMEYSVRPKNVVFGFFQE